jgi:predicted unusual protein kinase regulating ubiquinone biosynthesis (AarF/ABC1/UbiB family)
MKELDKIPISKVSRASKFIGTGAKVGGNYIKHYAKKLIQQEVSRESLDEENASDIYDSLSELKGSALKVAQMLSMDQGMLPTAYAQKFSQAQYSAPPLSYPLVMKTFLQQVGQSPTGVFDSFSKQAIKAASIGQVHQAQKDGQKLAIKVQYPGVAASIESDLRIVKPLARQLFNIGAAEMEYYMGEVKNKLIEECDYQLELKRGTEIAEACDHIEGLRFPKYYAELSGERIITMDWIEGMHLNEFLATNPGLEVRQRAAQTLWDFFNYQIHELRMVHADPHPGNFLFADDGTVTVIDFGCVKELPDQFYHQYFQLINGHVIDDKKAFEKILEELKFLLPEDKAEERSYFTEVFYQIIELLGRPFRTNAFDFGDQSYFSQIYELGELYSKDKTLRRANGARGPKDALYINRTYFGLYSILNQLGATIRKSDHTPEEILALPV